MINKFKVVSECKSIESISISHWEYSVLIHFFTTKYLNCLLRKLIIVLCIVKSPLQNIIFSMLAKKFLI